jgi:hypothetical protein
MSTARVRAEKTFGTFFVPRMHAIGSRIIIKTEIVPIASVATSGTMISVAHTTTSLLDVVLQLEVVMQEESRLSPAI